VYILAAIVMRKRMFLIQIGEATLCSGTCHMTASVRYVEDTKLYEDIIFCKSIKRRVITKEHFRIVDDIVKEKYIK
jgi:hypothetical protein